jgi:hypothetical protein
MPTSLPEFRRKFPRMKIGDHVYLITDRLKTGAGPPWYDLCPPRFHDRSGCAVRSWAKVSDWEDVLSPNLYTHSILNLVYQASEEIEHKYGSIL